MHPIQLAVAKLHGATEALHHSIAGVDFDAEKDTVWTVLVGMLPDIMEAAQDLSIAAFQFLTNR